MVAREDGIAVILAMMAMLLMTALAAALVLASSSETIVAASFRDSAEAMYAADAALEHAIDSVAASGDWNLLLSGSVQSPLADGPPQGTRTLADGSSIDLAELRNMANCSKRVACTADDLNRVTRERPRGANNPHWQLYSYGNLASLMPGRSIDSPHYVAVMIGDDPSDNDGNPEADGVAPCRGAVPSLTGDPPAPTCNPGSDVIVLRSAAFGPRGARKIVEATLARFRLPASASAAIDHPALPNAEPELAASPAAATGEPQGYNEDALMAVRVLSWREVR